MKNHFPKFKDPNPIFKMNDGGTSYEFPSRCGFNSRTIVFEIDAVDCLLCLRSLARSVRTARESALKEIKPETPELFLFDDE